MKKNPKIFINHILESIEEIEKHIKEITKDDFYRDIKTQDAVIRRIQIIGEAVKNLSAEFIRNHAEIEWQEIASMRDKLIHGYFGVSLAILWETVRKDIPELKKKVSKLLEEF